MNWTYQRNLRRAEKIALADAARQEAYVIRTGDVDAAWFALWHKASALQIRAQRIERIAEARREHHASL